jgi:hypothetical protein
MGNHLGQIEVSFEYLRHHGPRFAHGAVRLQFDSMRKHSFRSEAVWPEGADYTAAIRESVESVLISRLGSLEQGAVVLKSVSFNPAHSSEEGFRRAARAAAEAAFSV